MLKLVKKSSLCENLGSRRSFIALFIAMTIATVSTESLAQEVSGPSFRSLVRSAFEQDGIATGDQDLTKEFYQRTIEANHPKLEIEIPTQNLRDDGPRIFVKKFEFVRLVEFPEAGINRAEVEALAEDLRSRYMKEDDIFASGYIRTDLEELADYLNKVEAIDNIKNLSGKDLQQLNNMMRKQNAKRGVSYADLEEITNKLTLYYRSKGLFLAQVLIPAQEVVNGIIMLTVQEGILGDVVVENNEDYSVKLLKEAFKRNIDELVSHTKMEEGLYLLNDLPSLNVTGYFLAGDDPGETILNLKVTEDASWNMTTRADNHGSTFTGDNRISTSLEWQNPSGKGDALTISYLKSNSVENFDNDFGSDLGQFKYSIPVFGLRTRFEISAVYNQFKLADQSDESNSINLLEIEGVNKTYAISLDHKFSRSRAFNMSAAVSITDKETELEAIIEIDTGEHVRGGEVAFSIDALSQSVQMLNMLNFKVQFGEHQNEVDEARSNNFYKFALDTNSLIFVPLPFTDSKSRLIMKWRVQYSNEALPAFEQLSLGGANGVRAYNVRDFSGDQAALLSVEWYFNMPEVINVNVWGGKRLNEVFQFGLIADAGYGSLNSYEADSVDNWAALAGAGLTFKLNWEEKFAIQLSVSHPMMSKSSEGLNSSEASFVDEAKSAQVYADFSFFF
jgi:hemolysin activation/secretion protein